MKCTVEFTQIAGNEVKCLSSENYPYYVIWCVIHTLTTERSHELYSL